MEEFTLNLAQKIDFVIYVIVLVTFFIISFRLKKIKEILEINQNKNPETLIELMKKEEFKNNSEAAKGYLYDAFYYKIKEIVNTHIKNYSLTEEIRIKLIHDNVNDFIVKYDGYFKKYKIEMPDIKEFYKK